MSIFEVQQKLIETWANKNVDEAYQNIFLENADGVDEETAMKIMQEEISNVIKGKSVFDNLCELKKERLSCLNQLIESLKDKEEPLGNAQLVFLCDSVEKLRKANLELVEKCLSFGRSTQQSSPDPSTPTPQYSKIFSQSYSPLFIQINQDNKILKNSVLQNYIDMSQEFDPFLMKQYENIKNYQMPVHEEVRKIYNFGLAMSYRFIKAKKDMQGCLKINIKKKWESKLGTRVAVKDKQPEGSKKRLNSGKLKSSSPLNQTKYTEVRLPKLSLGKIHDAHNTLLSELKQTERKPKKKQRISIVILDQEPKKESSPGQKKWNSFTFSRDSALTKDSRNGRYSSGAMPESQDQRGQKPYYDDREDRYIEQVEEDEQYEGQPRRRPVKRVRQLQPLNPTRNSDYNDNRPGRQGEDYRTLSRQQPNYYEYQEQDEEELDRNSMPIRNRNKNYRKAIPKTYQRSKSEQVEARDGQGIQRPMQRDGYQDDYPRQNRRMGIESGEESYYNNPSGGRRNYQEGSEAYEQRRQLREEQYRRQPSSYTPTGVETPRSGTQGYPTSSNNRVQQSNTNTIDRTDRTNGRNMDRVDPGDQSGYRMDRQPDRQADRVDRNANSTYYDQIKPYLAANNSGPNREDRNREEGSGVYATVNAQEVSRHQYPQPSAYNPHNNNNTNQTNNGTTTNSNTTNQQNNLRGHPQYPTTSNPTTNPTTNTNTNTNNQPNTNTNTNPQTQTPRTTNNNTNTPYTSQQEQPHNNPPSNRTTTNPDTNTHNLTSQPNNTTSSNQPNTANNNQLTNRSNNSNTQPASNNGYGNTQPGTAGNTGRDGGGSPAGNTGAISGRLIKPATNTAESNNNPSNSSTNNTNNFNNTASRPTGNQTGPSTQPTSINSGRNNTSPTTNTTNNQTNNTTNPINPTSIHNANNNNPNSNTEGKPTQPAHKTDTNTGRQLSNQTGLDGNAGGNVGNLSGRASGGNNPSNTGGNINANPTNANTSTNPNNGYPPNSSTNTNPTTNPSTNTNPNTNTTQPTDKTADRNTNPATVTTQPTSNRNTNTNTNNPVVDKNSPPTNNNIANHPNTNSTNNQPNQTTNTTQNTTQNTNNKTNPAPNINANTNNPNTIPNTNPNTNINPIPNQTKPKTNPPQDTSTQSQPQNNTRPPAYNNILPPDINQPQHTNNQPQNNPKLSQNTSQNNTTTQNNTIQSVNTTQQLQNSTTQSQNNTNQPTNTTSLSQNTNPQQKTNTNIQQNNTTSPQNNNPTNNPPNNQNSNHQTNQTTSSQLKQTHPQKKQIKIIPGKNLTPNTILQHITTRPHNPAYSTPFLPTLEHSLNNLNMYYVQFLTNNKLSVFAISSADNDGGYTVRLWAPLQGECTDVEGLFLFRKYVSYLEKFTMLRHVHVCMGEGQGQGGSMVDMLTACGFVKGANGIYTAQRVSPITKTLDFKPFFSGEFSTISFLHEDYQHSYLYSEQIQPMSLTNSHTSPQIPFLTLPESLAPKSPLSQSSAPLKKAFKLANKIPNYKELNQLLVNEGYDDYEFEENMGLSDMGLAMVRMHFVMGGKAGEFFTQDGAVFVDGQIVREQGVALAAVECLVPGFGMYLAMGVETAGKAASMITAAMPSFPKSKKQKIGIKMFSKLLYGRILWDQSSEDEKIFRETNHGCYGNWESNLVWQDLLQGKISHPVQNLLTFGGNNTNFYLALSYQGQILFCFKVEPSNSIL